MAYTMWLWITCSTLLQLCRGEISDSQRESWYSANIINEEFHPRPISEIFSTETTFSQSNPIVILPKPNNIFPNDMNFWPSYAGPFNSVSSAQPLLSKPVSLSTPIPIPSSSEETGTTPSPEPSTPRSKPTTEKEFKETILHALQLTEHADSHKSDKLSSTLSPQQVVEAAVVSSEMPQKVQIVSTQPQALSGETYQSEATSQTFSESTIFPQPLSLETVISTARTFMSSSIATSSTSPSTALPSTFSSFAPQSPLPSTSASSIMPSTAYSSTLPSIAASSISPPTSLSSTSSTKLQEVYANTPLSSSAYSTSNTSFTSARSQSISDIPSTRIKPLPLTIHLRTPLGSITNFKLNPSTSKKPRTTIGTRKPKPKNLYKVCMDSCEGSKSPICAAPLAKGLIDPSTLKGFSSICHMACHNTFKEERYEKLVDGRCGKLRTRIRPVDSRNKLKRTELTKAEYTIENSDSQMVVEFTGLL